MDSGFNSVLQNERSAVYVPDRPLSPFTLACYGTGSLGTGVISTVPGLLLLYFMTDTLGIPAALAGVGVFFPKIWDMLFDPLMGSVSDRTVSRWGRRRPYLLLGSILASLTFALVFCVPQFASSRSAFFYVTGMFLLSTTGYSVFSVPYIAMPAEMSEDTHERTVIVSYRMAFAVAGVLIGAAFGPILVAWFGGGRHGYSAMGITLGMFCVLTMMVSFLASRFLRLREYRQTTLPLLRQIVLVFRNRPFCVLAISYIAQMAAVSSLYGALPYLAVYILGRGAKEVGLLLFTSFTASVLAMSPWARIARRVAKRSALMASIFIYVLSTIGLLLAGPRYPLILVFAQFAVMGVAFAGLQLFPFSMLTDAIELDLRNTGMCREGMFTGLWVAGEKAGLALGPLIVGGLLSAFGFTALAGGTAHQPASVHLGIRLGTSLIPAVLMTASLLILFAHPPPAGASHESDGALCEPTEPNTAIAAAANRAKSAPVRE